MRLLLHIAYIISIITLYECCEYIKRSKDGDIFKGEKCNITTFNYPWKDGCKCMAANSTFFTTFYGVKCYNDNLLLKEQSAEVYPIVDTGTNIIHITRCKMVTLEEVKIHDCIKGWSSFRDDIKVESIMTFNESQIVLATRRYWDGLLVVFTYKCLNTDDNNVLAVKFTGAGRKYPLPGALNKILQTVVEDEMLDERTKSNYTPIIIGVVITIVIATCIGILVVYFCRRKKNRSQMYTDKEYPALSVSYKPGDHVEPEVKIQTNMNEDNTYEPLIDTPNKKNQVKIANEYLRPVDTNDGEYEKMLPDYIIPNNIPKTVEDTYLPNHKYKSPSNKTDKNSTTMGENIRIPNQENKTPNNKPDNVKHPDINTSAPKHLRTEKMWNQQGKFHANTANKKFEIQSSAKYKVPNNKPISYKNDDLIRNNKEDDYQIPNTTEKDDTELDYQVPKNLLTEEVDYQVPNVSDQDHDYQIPTNAPIYSNM